jgi:hypothetical protein
VFGAALAWHRSRRHRAGQSRGEGCGELKLSKVLKIHRSRHHIASEQLAARGGWSKSGGLLMAFPPPSRRRCAAARNGEIQAGFRSTAQIQAGFRSTAPTWTLPGDPNSQARSSLAQRELVRSTGGDRPSGTDMKHLAAARTTECHRKSVPGTPKHTGGSRLPRTWTSEPMAGVTGGSTGLGIKN